MKRWKSTKDGEIAAFFFNNAAVEKMWKSGNCITHFEKLKDCGVEKKNLLKILWKTRKKSKREIFSKIGLLKLLKWKIGFSWKTVWIFLPAHQKYPETTENSGFPQIVENAVERLMKVCGKPQKTQKIRWIF